MTEKIKYKLNDIKQKIEEFYDKKQWHFVCLNASDIDGICNLQWIFSKYEEKDRYRVFECDVEFNSTIPSISKIIPSAIMSEMEIVDLFGLKIEEVKSGLYLDETSIKSPLKEDNGN